MVTIKDVAKKAGVSIAAVSYALNDKEGVNDATKKRLKQIAEEMGYIPNSLAQGLLNKKTNIIGLVIPDISNMYTASMIKYLDHYARQNGFFLLLGSLSNAAESAADVFDQLIAKNVDSFIISPAPYDESIYASIIDKLNKRGIPFLFTNLHFPQIPSHYVVPDLNEGEFQMTRHLLGLGLRDFAFVGGSRQDYISEIRYQGFLRALESYSLEHDRCRYIEINNSYSFEDGYRAAHDYRTHHALPEVFVTLNDSIAYGLIKGLKALGVKVPEDVGVVGFDDLGLPTIDSIELTTVRIPVEEMARQCIEILRNPSKSTSYQQTILPTQLIVRDSVKHKNQ